jgi:hypothetical protein
MDIIVNGILTWYLQMRSKNIHYTTAPSPFLSVCFSNYWQPDKRTTVKCEFVALLN